MSSSSKNPVGCQDFASEGNAGRVQAAQAPAAAAPERMPAPSSGQLAPRAFEESATLLIIVLGMAALTVAAALLLTMP